MENTFPTLNLPKPLGSDRRYILRTLLQNRGWTGKSVGLLTVDELAAGLAVMGVSQPELDEALNTPTVPLGRGPAPITAAPRMADPLSADAAALRRQIGAMVFDGNTAGADAVVNDLLRRVMAAEAEAQALRAGASVAPVEGATAALPEVNGFKTAGELFGLPRAKFASWKLATYTPTIHTPKVDPRYRWDAKVCHQALACFRMAAHGGDAGNVALIGPPGTGKSSWCKQYAAITGRSFFEISFSDTVEANDLIGTIDPTYTNGLRWKDGVFTTAIRTPGAVILLDEVGAIKPSTGVAFNEILQARSLTIAETAEVVPFADGVVVMATSNDLLGRTSAGMQHFSGLHRQNSAFADRWAVQVLVDYPSKATEASMLRDHVHGMTKTLATLLVEMAALSRAKLGADEVSYGMGFRRLVSWGNQLMAGAPCREAFASTVLHFMPEGDHEVYRELAKAQGVLDEAVIDAARNDATVAPRDPNAPGSEFEVIEDDDSGEV